MQRISQVLMFYLGRGILFMWLHFVTRGSSSSLFFRTQMFKNHYILTCRCLFFKVLIRILPQYRNYQVHWWPHIWEWSFLFTITCTSIFRELDQLKTKIFRDVLDKFTSGTSRAGSQEERRGSRTDNQRLVRTG